MAPAANIERSAQLPRLAWVLRFDGSRLDALVGNGVAITETSIFEGGWAMTPGPDALRPEGIYFGSGAAWADGTLTLISPSHRSEWVWVVETAEAVWASNSLPLVVKATGLDSFDPVEARSALDTYQHGYVASEREIHRSEDARLLRYFNALVRIGSDRVPVEQRQRQERGFDSYGSYVAHLNRVAAETLATSGHEECAVLLSRGYDSPAAAVVARDTGPTTAICVDKTAAGEDDDGSEIAEALGLPAVGIARPARRVIERTADGWVRRREVVEPADYETIAPFYNYHTANDAVFAAAEEWMTGRLVFTGWTGDRMWTLEGEVWRNMEGSPAMALGDPSLGEFRLHAGFTSIHIPAIGFDHADVVRTIGLSDELAPWRVGGDYDRPVPRRMVEEAGVPRDAFGRRKMFVVLKIARLLDIARTLFDLQIRGYVPAVAGWQGRRPAKTSD